MTQILANLDPHQDPRPEHDTDSYKSGSGSATLLEANSGIAELIKTNYLKKSTL